MTNSQSHKAEQANQINEFIREMADAVHQRAKQNAKNKFADLIKSVPDGELSPEELELYYDAFADLTDIPDEARNFVLKEMKRLLLVQEEPTESPTVIEGEIISSPKSPPNNENSSSSSDEKTKK